VIKVRLMGLEEQVTCLADMLESTGTVVERSAAYANRGTSKQVRVYLEIELSRVIGAKPTVTLSAQPHIGAVRPELDSLTGRED
jgi:hypothetical protein